MLVVRFQEIIGEQSQAIEQHLPCILLWQQQDRISHPLDVNLGTFKAKLKRESYRLTAAVYE